MRVVATSKLEAFKAGIRVVVSLTCSGGRIGSRGGDMTVTAIITDEETSVVTDEGISNGYEISNRIVKVTPTSENKFDERVSYHAEVTVTSGKASITIPINIRC